MAQHVIGSSVALRVVLYFARNHEEELTAADISVKFEIHAKNVNDRLSRAERDGMLTKKSSGPGRGRHSVYSAGPKLLQMIGQNLMIEANVPVPYRGTCLVGL